jgi:hypothetical protein
MIVGTVEHVALGTVAKINWRKGAGIDAVLNIHGISPLRKSWPSRFVCPTAVEVIAFDRRVRCAAEWPRTHRSSVCVRHRAYLSVEAIAILTATRVAGFTPPKFTEEAERYDVRALSGRKTDVRLSVVGQHAREVFAVAQIDGALLGDWTRAPHLAGYRSRTPEFDGNAVEQPVASTERSCRRLPSAREGAAGIGLEVDLERWRAEQVLTADIDDAHVRANAV